MASAMPKQSQTENPAQGGHSRPLPPGASEDTPPGLLQGACPPLPMLLLVSLLRLSSAQFAIHPDDHAQEVAFLHTPLSPTLLRRVQIWDDKLHDWRDAKSAELWEDKTPLLIVHLWATWCAPCVDELALWRELTPLLERTGQVRVLFVAVQSQSPDVDAFLTKHAARMPQGPLYHELGESLSSRLRERVTDRRLQYPITLVLDSDRIVRQAFVGSVHSRRGELLQFVTNLMHLLTTKPK